MEKKRSVKVFYVEILHTDTEHSHVECHSKTEALKIARDWFNNRPCISVRAYNSLYENQQPYIYYRVRPSC